MNYKELQQALTNATASVPGLSHAHGPAGDMLAARSLPYPVLWIEDEMRYTPQNENGLARYEFAAWCITQAQTTTPGKEREKLDNEAQAVAEAQGLALQWLAALDGYGQRRNGALEWRMLTSHRAGADRVVGVRLELTLYTPLNWPCEPTPYAPY